MQLPRAPNIVASCLQSFPGARRREEVSTSGKGDIIIVTSRQRVPATAQIKLATTVAPPSAVAIREHSLLATTSRNWPVDTGNHPNSFTSRNVMLTFRSRLANWTSTRCFGSRWEGPITTPLVSFLTMTWPFTVMSWVAFTF